MPLGLKIVSLWAIFLLAVGGCLTSANLPNAEIRTITTPVPPSGLPTTMPYFIPDTEAPQAANPTPTPVSTATATPKPEVKLRPRVTGLSGTDLGQGLQLRVYLPQEEIEETVKKVVITFPAQGSIERVIGFNRQKEAYYSGVAYVEPSLLEGRDLQWIQQNLGISVSTLREQIPCSDNMRPSNDCSVAMLYPTVPGTAFWDSHHWSDGHSRVITSGWDANDPTGWSHLRGIGTIEVNGKGILTMRGSEPRLYLNGAPGKVWKNVEATVYYKRIKDDGKWGGGLVIGARSGPDGHTKQSPCTATTYYGRVRHVGEADFYKELKHPSGEVKSRVKVWNNEPLPHDQWIGVKFVVYNSQDEESVKLELYRDLTEGVNGGDWEKLAEYTDAGGWGNAEGCPYASDLVVTQGGRTVFIRNTGIEEAQYKWFSVREIIAPVN